MIIEKIRTFLETDPDIRQNMLKEIKDTDFLIDSGIIDSFGIIKLILFIEKTFEINVDFGEIIKEGPLTLESLEMHITNKKKNE